MDKCVQKKQLRQVIRQEKKQLSKEQRVSCANKVFEQLEKIPEFVKAEYVLCYWALPDELSTQQFIHRWYQQKKIYLPRVVNSELEIVLYSGSDSMKVGAYYILEPIGKSIDDMTLIDLVVVPGVAFTVDGDRLGRGGGFYDKFLAKVPHAFKVGVGYQFQIKDLVPCEKHDIKMDRIITG